jgi:hypothetical protein
MGLAAVDTRIRLLKEQGRLLFVNQKKQKNFMPWDNACDDGSAPRNRLGAKFFASFFKKEALPSLR